MPKRASASYERTVVSLRDALLSEVSEPSSSMLGEQLVVCLCNARGKAGADDLDSSDVLLMTHALHAAMMELARRADEANCSVMKMEGTELFVDSLMDMVCQHSPPFDLSTPAACLEVLMEITPTMDCGEILEFLDSRMEIFTKPGIRQKSQYTLLRTCNLLLKRLGSRDALLCGRVLVFLAKFLPLTERSGVNIHGSFNVNNLTPLDDVREGDLDAEGRAVDVPFYKTFWGLQSWFADPRSALAPGACDSIMESIQTVLKRFRAVRVTVTGASSISSVSTPASASESASSSSVKYLSSAGLLPLQIRDATFRRTVLVQSLILIGWLENPLLKDFVSKRPSDHALAQIESTKEKVMDMLRRTPDNGTLFVDAVSKVLDGEMAWSLWKQGGCSADAFQRRGAAFDATMLVNELQADPIGGEGKTKRQKSEEATYGVDMGVPELTRLWNLTEDNLTMLSADDRGGFTSLRSLMDPVIDEINDPNVDEMFSVASDQMYNWKTLRMVSRSSLPTFAAAVRAGGDLKICCKLLYPEETGPLGEGDVMEDIQRVDGELELGPAKANAEDVQKAADAEDVQKVCDAEDVQKVCDADHGAVKPDETVLPQEGVASPEAKEEEKEEGEQ